MVSLQTIIEFLGTFAFAISGIRWAAFKKFDWFGGYVVGLATAIGGGTIRDVMLGLPPFWMTNSIYLVCTAMALILVIVLKDVISRLSNTWFIFDGIIHHRRHSKDSICRLSILGSDSYGLYYRSCRWCHS